MKVGIALAAVLALLGASGIARADNAWSTYDYDLHAGDFDGDGRSDILYIARDPARVSGIALADDTGFGTSLQTWGNAYLGIPWSGGHYNVVVGDFNGDGRDDLFLQRRTPGDHYLILTEQGGIGAISQAVPNHAAGLEWSADAHRIIAGDFDGDGRADLLLQPTRTSHITAVMLSDENGQFTATAPAQSWQDGYGGFRWTLDHATIFAGDFNGDGFDDLLVQARPLAGTGPGTKLPATFEPNANGVLLAQPGAQIFLAEHLQAWGQEGFSAQWSPLRSTPIVGDWNGDGRDDVILQGLTANERSHLLYGRQRGAIFEPAVVLDESAVAPSDQARAIAGSFASAGADALYFQQREAVRSNRVVGYPTSTSGYRLKLKYVYSYGFLQQVKDNATGAAFWTLNAANDAGSPLTEVLGNGVLITSGYKPWTNELTSRQEGTGGSTNNLQDLAYQWDLNGNLSQRQDLKQGLTEIFVNDPLNRLTSSTLNGVSNLSVGYNAAGNITSKSDAGSYDYTTAQAGCSYYAHTQPHAVRKAGSAVYCYDANGNVTSRGGGSINWYSFNQPKQISYAGNSTEFSYDANHQRWKQVANYGGVAETIWYIGGLLEKVTRSGVTEYRHRIPAGSASAIYTRRDNGTNSTFYVTSDHLGSGDLILDSAANILARESFTPFGARRGSNWQGNPTGGDYTTFQNTTRRGFTGHEMLDAVSLVHMNGRVYDPYVGRFLAPDPIIQTLALSQALNPFSYVMNNPLSLIDPSGYSWLSKAFRSIGKFFKKFWRPIVAIVAAVVTFGYLAPMASQWLAASVCLMPGTITAGGAAIAGGIAGALAGGITGGWRGALAGAVTGGMLGGIGQHFGNSWTLKRVAIEGLAGGVGSEIKGGSFVDGFKFAFGFAALRWSAFEMRHAMFRQSCTPAGNLNCTGDSVGAFGDKTKIGGGRLPWPRDSWSDVPPSTLGGNQGQQGMFFGRAYGAGSFRDRLVESYAGPHDWLSSFRYGLRGDLIPYTSFGSALFTAYSTAALFIATPFAVATAAPSWAVVSTAAGEI